VTKLFAMVWCIGFFLDQTIGFIIWKIYKKIVGIKDFQYSDFSKPTSPNWNYLRIKYHLKYLKISEMEKFEKFFLKNHSP